MAVKIMEAFNPRAFERYGFTRYPEKDFSDDGNRFRMYLYHDELPMSYLRADGDVYIALRPDYIDGISYREYSKLPSYNDANKYNGVPEDSVDLDDLSLIAERLTGEIKELKVNIKDADPDAWNEFCSRYINLYTNAYQDIVEIVKSKFLEILELDDYKIKEIKGYLRSLKQDISKWNKMKDMPMNSPVVRDNLSEEGLIQQKKDIDNIDDYFYVRKLRDMLSKI